MTIDHDPTRAVRGPVDSLTEADDFWIAVNRTIADLTAADVERIHAHGLNPDELDVLDLTSRGAVCRRDGRWVRSVNVAVGVLAAAGLAEPVAGGDGPDHLAITDAGEQALRAAERAEGEALAASARADLRQLIASHALTAAVAVLLGLVFGIYLTGR